MSVGWVGLHGMAKPVLNRMLMSDARAHCPVGVLCSGWLRRSLRAYFAPAASRAAHWDDQVSRSFPTAAVSTTTVAQTGEPALWLYTSQDSGTSWTPGGGNIALRVTQNKESVAVRLVCRESLGACVHLSVLCTLLCCVFSNTTVELQLFRMMSATLHCIDTAVILLYVEASVKIQDLRWGVCLACLPLCCCMYVWGLGADTPTFPMLLCTFLLLPGSCDWGDEERRAPLSLSCTATYCAVGSPRKVRRAACHHDPEEKLRQRLPDGFKPWRQRLSNRNSVMRQKKR